MSQENVEIAHRAVAAWDDWDVEAMWALTDPEALLRYPSGMVDEISMSYFIKSAGTAEGPLPADWHRGGASWREKHGDVGMFSRRPRIEPGDRLVHYAVGSAAQFKTGRIFAVVEVLSEPEPSGHERWPWQVTGRMLVPGPRLPNCPSIEDIGVEQTSLRRQSHITLTDEQGTEAERLIARAAERAGSLGHCYKGPAPPAGFVPGR